MLEKLKYDVLQANLELVKQNLVIYTWGNVSGIDRDKNLIVIKPSGVDYNTLKVKDMVVVDFNGKVIEGKLKPSSDTPTHIELYKNFKNINGIVHTHSTYAVSWAQSGRDIPAYGTTHADYFYGDIPCTKFLTKIEIEECYEKNTAISIIQRFNGLDANALPGVLCAGHGPFSWGKTPMSAVHNAKVLETIAEMAYRTECISKKSQRISQFLLDKHYFRKHGKNAYYGQTTSKNIF